MINFFNEELVDEEKSIVVINNIEKNLYTLKNILEKEFYLPLKIYIITDNSFRNKIKIFKIKNIFKGYQFYEYQVKDIIDFNIIFNEIKNNYGFLFLIFDRLKDVETNRYISLNSLYKTIKLKNNNLVEVSFFENNTNEILFFSFQNMIDEGVLDKILNNLENNRFNKITSINKLIINKNSLNKLDLKKFNFNRGEDVIFR